MAEKSFVSANHLGKVGDAAQDPEPEQQAEQKAVSSMNRAELEAYAAEVGVENPGDKEQFPNMDALRDAIAATENGEGDV